MESVPSVVSLALPFSVGRVCVPLSHDVFSVCGVCVVQIEKLRKYKLTERERQRQRMSERERDRELERQSERPRERQRKRECVKRSKRQYFLFEYQVKSDGFNVLKHVFTASEKTSTGEL